MKNLNLILIAAGCFLDAISIFYVIVPILLSVVHTLGVDPVHFGIIVTVNLAIGQITPPIGVNLVAAPGVSGIGIKDISRASLLFISVELAALLLIILIPGISLLLPDLLLP